jgi:ABC-type uncharacterized transport system permease subunit
LSFGSDAVTARSPRRRDRLASAFLLVLIAIGSVALWVGVPVGALWGLSKVTHSNATHFLAALVVIPVGLILFGIALAWLNRLYLRVQQASQPNDAEQPRVTRGPLEYLMRWSLLFAFTAFVLWFFILAERPCSCSAC